MRALLDGSIDAQMKALRSEADARERGLHELTAIIAARDARIAELERMAEERLTDLNSMHRHIEAVRSEADARERGLHELTAIIAARDARVADLERVAEERLAAITRIENSLAEAHAALEDLSKRFLVLEQQTLVEYVSRRVRKLKV